jgi:hypothetical protein
LPGNRAGGWIGNQEENQEGLRESFARSGQFARVLEQFHQTDQPQFTRRLNNHFGALLTELRELNPKMAADGQAPALHPHQFQLAQSGRALVRRIEPEMAKGLMVDSAPRMMMIKKRFWD